MSTGSSSVSVVPVSRQAAPNAGTHCAAAREWSVHASNGPVIATAIHNGHEIRASLQGLLEASEANRRHEEDPLTGVLATVGDTQVRVHASRFQVDMNRSRDKAVPQAPADTWGMKVWRETLPTMEVAESLQTYDRFHAQIRGVMDGLIARWGRVLLLDVHSYNHRRDGADAAPSDVDVNPDIDLGVTTFEHARYGTLAARFRQALCEVLVAGRTPDVRENVRYPDGGDFPEWIHATYGDQVCTITLEYKKIYMNEWTGMADIGVLDDLCAGLRHAVQKVRPEFMTCR